jgi:hypothetical protein
LIWATAAAQAKPSTIKNTLRDLYLNNYISSGSGIPTRACREKHSPHLQGGRGGKTREDDNPLWKAGIGGSATLKAFVPQNL